MTGPGRSALSRLGVGLWSMQSTAAAPASARRLYRDFRAAAALADRLGLHSIWSAEHRGWYDGWCPALMNAQAFAAAGTERVRFGTAMLLAPQHDPLALARASATLDRLTGGRVDLGVGLGYRDEEFDALGLERRRRGRMMDEVLATLAAAWAGEHGDEPTVQRPGPPVWVGGIARPAIERAVRAGHGLMLPQAVSPEKVRSVVEAYEGAGAVAARVGVLRDVCVTDDPAAAERFRAELVEHYREEIGSWWPLGGGSGFDQPERLESQLELFRDAALVGPAELVGEGIAALVEAGAELVCLRVAIDHVAPAGVEEQMRRVAAEVAPLLEGVGRCAS